MKPSLFSMETTEDMAFVRGERDPALRDPYGPPPPRY
jgi:hypothetical protein